MRNAFAEKNNGRSIGGGPTHLQTLERCASALRASIPTARAGNAPLCMRSADTACPRTPHISYRVPVSYRPAASLGSRRGNRAKGVGLFAAAHHVILDPPIPDPSPPGGNWIPDPVGDDRLEEPPCARPFAGIQAMQETRSIDAFVLVQPTVSFNSWAQGRILAVKSVRH